VQFDVEARAQVRLACSCAWADPNVTQALVRRALRLDALRATLARASATSPSSSTVTVRGELSARVRALLAPGEAADDYLLPSEINVVEVCMRVCVC
jgi:hypothetical protein